MHNVQELERKWIQYKIKSYSLYIAIIVILTLLVPMVIFFFPKTLHVSDKNTTFLIPKKSITSDRNHSVKRVELSHTETNQTAEKLVLRPSLSFVDKMDTSSNTPPIQAPTAQTVKETAVKHVSPTKSSFEPPKTALKPTYTVKTVTNNKKINIQTHTMDDDLQDVAQRFKKTNNPTLGLFLAKKYYEMGQYDLSYNYALLTNQLDSKIDMSWIIFAKSLVKLGQKEKAITTLQSYSKNSHSKQALTLLDEIESGRFR